MLAALLVVAQLALTPLGETDLFFHLELGQLILASGKIPFVNLFSFTYPAHPDPDLASGFQVLVALAYQVGGFGAIVALKAALVVGAAALVWGAARRAGARPLPTALAVVLAALAAEPRLVERPHLVTFVGLGALQWLMAGVERGRRRRVWLAVPLVWLWAQFHAGVFLAPLWLAGYALGARLDGRRARLLGVIAASSAAMFLTPAGTRLPAYLLWHTGLGATRVIDEFRVADLWNDPWFFICVWACALTALAMLLGRRGAPWRLRLGWRRLVPLALVGVLAWRSVRFVAEWAWLAAPVLALAGDAVARRALALMWRPRRWRAALAATFVGVSLAAVLTARRQQPWPLQLADDVVPFRAIDYVTANGLRERLYSDLEVGCYLLWQGWPRYRVFQDARLPAYPDELHRALDQTPLQPAAFDALLRRYDVDSALLAYPGVNMRAGSFDPEEWALVWRDETALVFVRRLPRFRDVIARDEIPLALRFSFSDGSRVVPLGRPPALSPVDPCQWQRRLAAQLDAIDSAQALDARASALAGGCLSEAEQAEVHFLLGARAQAAGATATAVREYDRALALRPNDARVLANRGYLPVGRADARTIVTRSGNGHANANANANGER